LSKCTQSKSPKLQKSKNHKSTLIKNDFLFSYSFIVLWKKTNVNNIKDHLTKNYLTLQFLFIFSPSFFIFKAWKFTWFFSVPIHDTILGRIQFYGQNIHFIELIHCDSLPFYLIHKYGHKFWNNYKIHREMKHFLKNIPLRNICILYLNFWTLFMIIPIYNLCIKAHRESNSKNM